MSLRRSLRIAIAIVALLGVAPRIAAQDEPGVEKVDPKSEAFGKAVEDKCQKEKTDELKRKCYLLALKEPFNQAGIHFRAAFNDHLPRAFTQWALKGIQAGSVSCSAEDMKKVIAGTFCFKEAASLAANTIASYEKQVEDKKLSPTDARKAICSSEPFVCAILDEHCGNPISDACQGINLGRLRYNLAAGAKELQVAKGYVEPWFVAKRQCDKNLKGSKLDCTDARVWSLGDPTSADLEFKPQPGYKFIYKESLDCFRPQNLPAEESCLKCMEDSETPQVASCKAQALAKFPDPKNPKAADGGGEGSGDASNGEAGKGSGKGAGDAGKTSGGGGKDDTTVAGSVFGIEGGASEKGGGGSRGGDKCPAWLPEKFCERGSKGFECPAWIPKEFCGAGRTYDYRYYKEREGEGNNLERERLRAKFDQDGLGETVDNAFTFHHYESVPYPNPELGKVPVSKVLSGVYDTVKYGFEDEIYHFSQETFIESFLQQVKLTDPGDYDYYLKRLKDMLKGNAKCDKELADKADELDSQLGSSSKLGEAGETFRKGMVHGARCAGAIEDRIEFISREFGLDLEKYSVLLKSETIESLPDGVRHLVSALTSLPLVRQALRQAEFANTANIVEGSKRTCDYLQVKENPNTPIKDGLSGALGAAPVPRASYCRYLSMEFAMLSQELEGVYSSFPMLATPYGKSAPTTGAYIRKQIGGDSELSEYNQNFFLNNPDMSKVKEGQAPVPRCMDRVKNEAPPAKGLEAVDHVLGSAVTAQQFNQTLDLINSCCNKPIACVKEAFENPKLMTEFYECPRARFTGLAVTLGTPAARGTEKPDECRNRADSSWVACQFYREQVRDKDRDNAVSEGIQIAMDSMMLGGLEGAGRFAFSAAGAGKGAVVGGTFGYGSSFLGPQPDEVATRALYDIQAFYAGKGSKESYENALATLRKLDTDDPKVNAILEGIAAGGVFGAFEEHPESPGAKEKAKTKAKAEGKTADAVKLEQELGKQVKQVEDQTLHASSKTTPPSTGPPGPKSAKGYGYAVESGSAKLPAGDQYVATKSAGGAVTYAKVPSGGKSSAEIAQQIASKNPGKGVFEIRGKIYVADSVAEAVDMANASTLPGGPPTPVHVIQEPGTSGAATIGGGGTAGAGVTSTAVAPNTLPVEPVPGEGFESAPATKPGISTAKPAKPSYVEAGVPDPAKIPKVERPAEIPAPPKNTKGPLGAYEGEENLVVRNDKFIAARKDITSNYSVVMGKGARQMAKAIAEGKVPDATTLLNELAKDRASLTTDASFGKWRTGEWQTPIRLDGPYASYFSKIPKELKIEYETLPSGRKVRLGGYVPQGPGAVLLIHTPPGDIGPILDHVNSLYKKLRDPGVTGQAAIQTVAEMQWWLVRAMPFERGSAGIIDASSKSLLYSKGIFPGRWKAGIIFDLEAFTRSKADFIAHYASFFDGGEDVSFAKTEPVTAKVPPTKPPVDPKTEVVVKPGEPPKPPVAPKTEVVVKPGEPPKPLSPALSATEKQITPSLVQKTTRGNQLELGQQFAKKDIDFAAAADHLKIHHDGEVAGSQFNGALFKGPDDVKNAVLSQLPENLHYDQFGRAELTLTLKTPGGEPAGFTGVMSDEEILAKFPGSKIKYAQRNPGGVPAVVDGIQGAWFPEMEQQGGKWVVARNPDGSIKNPHFKFEPDARIVTVAKKDFEAASATYKVTVIIEKGADGKPVVRTIFPGDGAPPFPSKTAKGSSLSPGTPEADYWQHHVFVKVGEAEPVTTTLPPTKPPAVPKTEVVVKPGEPPKPPAIPKTEISVKDATNPNTTKTKSGNAFEMMGGSPPGDGPKTGPGTKVVPMPEGIAAEVPACCKEVQPGKPAPPLAYETEQFTPYSDEDPYNAGLHKGTSAISSAPPTQRFHRTPMAPGEHLTGSTLPKLKVELPLPPPGKNMSNLKVLDAYNARRMRSYLHDQLGIDPKQADSQFTFIDKGGFSSAYYIHPPAPSPLELVAWAKANNVTEVNIDAVRRAWAEQHATAVVKLRNPSLGGADPVAGAARVLRRDLAVQGLFEQLAPKYTYDGKPLIRLEPLASGAGDMAAVGKGVVSQKVVRGIQVDALAELARRAVDEGSPSSIARLKQLGLTPEEAMDRIRALEQFYRDTHADVLNFEGENGLSTYTNWSASGKRKAVGFDFNHGTNVKWDPASKQFVAFDF